MKRTESHVWEVAEVLGARVWGLQARVLLLAPEPWPVGLPCGSFPLSLGSEHVLRPRMGTGLSLFSAARAAWSLLGRGSFL